MDWAERNRVSRYLYREVTYQAIYALKSGNVLFADDPKTGEGRPEKAQRRVLQSKLTISGLFFLTFLASSLVLSKGREFIATTLSPVYFDATVITMVLVVLFSLVWITGLQVALPFVSSQALTALQVLPVSRQDATWISFLAFLRLFDTPLLTAIVVFPVTVGIGLGSWTAGLATLPVVILTEIFALALSLSTAGFFSRRVTGASGGSFMSLLERWVYLILWTIPSLVITVFVTFSLSIIATLGDWQSSDPTAIYALFSVFPFPYTYLMAVLGTHASVPTLVAVLMVISGLIYLGVGALAARWLISAPLGLGSTTMVTRPRGPPGVLVVSRPAVAILKKDLRMASRTPAYAFLLLLPLLDSFVLGLFTYLGNPNPLLAERYAVAGVTVAVLLATFFGPVFFATEVMGFTLTRTMPVKQSTLIIGKTTLISLVYISSFLIVAMLVASRVNDIVGFLLFALAELPAVVAAALLEIGILLNRAKKTGVPIASLYSGAWWTTLVVIPGLLVAVTPLLAYDLIHLAFISSLALMGITALAVLVAVALGVMRDKERPL